MISEKIKIILHSGIPLLFLGFIYTWNFMAVAMVYILQESIFFVLNFLKRGFGSLMTKIIKNLLFFIVFVFVFVFFVFISVMNKEVFSYFLIFKGAILALFYIIFLYYTMPEQVIGKKEQEAMKTFINMAIILIVLGSILDNIFSQKIVNIALIFLLIIIKIVLDLQNLNKNTENKEFIT